MTVTCVKSSDLSEPHWDRWRVIQSATPSLGSPYFCPEFTRAVAAVRDDVEVAVLHDTDGVAGFLPFSRVSKSIGAPVGGCLSDYQGVIADGELDFDPLAIMRACGLHAWDFDHLLREQRPFRSFHRVQTESPVIDLSLGFEQYLAGCRAARAEHRKLRRIEKELGPVRLVSHSTDAKLLGTVLDWKSSQYIEGALPDLFAPGWIREVVELIHQQQTPGFAGMLSVLYAGDRPIAGHFGMRSRDVWHWWFPSYDRAVSAYSPGLVLLIKMAEQAESLKLRVIDLGAGSSLYKRRFMNDAVGLASGSVELPSCLAFRRAAARRVRSLVQHTPLASCARKILRWTRG